MKPNDTANAGAVAQPTSNQSETAVAIGIPETGRTSTGRDVLREKTRGKGILHKHLYWTYRQHCYHRHSCGCHW